MQTQMPDFLFSTPAGLRVAVGSDCSFFGDQESLIWPDVRKRSTCATRRLGQSSRRTKLPISYVRVADLVLCESKVSFQRVSGASSLRVSEVASTVASPSQSLSSVERLQQAFDALESSILPNVNQPARLPRELSSKLKSYEKSQETQEQKAPAVPEKNNGWDDEDHNYVVKAGELLNGRYLIERPISKGAYGKVVRAWDLDRNEQVAIKIIKNAEAYFRAAQTEISVLNRISKHDSSDKYNSVRMLDNFVFRNHQCLVFELLSYNLHDVIRSTRYTGISLNMIRPITWQILKCMSFLALPDVNILHCDLKPENILLRQLDSSAVKVIDFGSAMYGPTDSPASANKKPHTYIQSRYYRCPEVLLGLPQRTRIDMWSLGCILVELHSGIPLFSGKNEEDQMRKICEVLGLPPREMIENSQHYAKFFEKRGRGYVLRAKDGVEPPRPASRQLRQVVGVDTHGPGGRHKGEPGHSVLDYLLFEDLVSKLLEYNPEKRLSPLDAMNHLFFRCIGPSDSTSFFTKTSSTPLPSPSTSDIASIIARNSASDSDASVFRRFWRF